MQLERLNLVVTDTDTSFSPCRVAFPDGQFGADGESDLPEQTNRYIA